MNGLQKPETDSALCFRNSNSAESRRSYCAHSAAVFYAYSTLFVELSIDSAIERERERERERVETTRSSFSYRSCISVSATFRQPTPAHCASLSTQHVRPSPGFSGRWSDGLELTARWTQRSGVWCWQLQKQSCSGLYQVD